MHFLYFSPLKLNVLCSSVSFLVGKLCLFYMVRTGRDVEQNKVTRVVAENFWYLC